MKKILATLAVMLILGLPAFAADNLNGLYKKAMQQYNLRHYAKAAELFKDYVKQRPEAAAYYRIGYCMYKLHKDAEADKYFEYAYFVSPDFSPGPFVSSMHPAAEPPAPKPGVKPAAAQAKPGALAPAPPAQIKPAAAAPAAPAAQAPAPAAPAVPAAQAKPATAVTAPISAAVQVSPATQVSPAATTAPSTPPLAPKPEIPVAPTAQAPKPAVPAPAPVPAQSFMAKNRMLVIIGAIVAVYLIISILLFRHARKAGVSASWIAFIPLIQFAVIVLAIKAHGAPPLSGPGPSDLPGFGDLKFTDEDFSSSSAKTTNAPETPSEPEKAPETKTGEFSFPAVPNAPDADAGKTPAEETTFEIPEEEFGAPGSEKFKLNLSEGSELTSEDFKPDAPEDASTTNKPAEGDKK